MKHTTLESPLDGESGIEKDPDHALIVLQDIGRLPASLATTTGYVYVTSQMGTALTGDPRDVALRDALYSALPGS